MTLREDANRIIQDSIQAAMPDSAVRRALERHSFGPGRLLLVAAGKGGWQMAKAAADTLGRVDGGLALANMELMAHAMGLGALYCGFAAHAIESDEELRALFGLTEKRKIDSCLVVGRTDLKFRRTAPRNPARARWL